MPAQDNPYLARAFDAAALHLTTAQRHVERYLSASFFDRDETDISEAKRAMNQAADELRTCLKQLGK